MHKLLAGLVVGFFAAWLSLPVQAGSVHVRPTTVVIGPGQAAATLTLTNQGDTPMTVQVRVFAWDQAQNQNTQRATDTLVVSPPMVTLAPRAHQSVRVVRVAKDKPKALEAYRLLVDEVPGGARKATTAVAIQMRYALPVFVVPRAKMAPAQLEASAHVKDGVLTLNARNQGERQAQAANVTLEYGANVRTPVVPGLLGYVLPGRSMQWALQLPANAQATGAPTRLVMKVNGQALEIDL